MPVTGRIEDVQHSEPNVEPGATQDQIARRLAVADPWERAQVRE